MKFTIGNFISVSMTLDMITLEVGKFYGVVKNI